MRPDPATETWKNVTMWQDTCCVRYSPQIHNSATRQHRKTFLDPTGCATKRTTQWPSHAKQSFYKRRMAPPTILGWQAPSFRKRLGRKGLPLSYRSTRHSFNASNRLRVAPARSNRSRIMLRLCCTTSCTVGRTPKCIILRSGYGRCCM